MGGTKNHFTLVRAPSWEISEHKEPCPLYLSDALHITIFGGDDGKPVSTVAFMSE